MDHKLKIEPVKYYHDLRYKCSWEPLDSIEKYFGKRWWLILYNGTVFAEMWEGKSGNTFALLYTVKKYSDGTIDYSAKMFWDDNFYYVQMAIVGAVLFPKN